VLRKWAYGPGVDERIAMYDSTCSGGGRCFYRTNWQGSTTHLVNQDGSIKDTYRYGPYGERVGWTPTDADTGNPFRYTGRRFDQETGLYHYRARYYSAVLGRFLQTDPIGTKDDLNMYAYVGGDALNALDPSGAEKVCATPTGSRISSCVGVDGDGEVADDDLTNNQASQLSTAFAGFIAANNGANLSSFGATVLRDAKPGVTGGIVAMVRAVSQFIGANLKGGWSDTVINVTGFEMGDDAGRLDYLKNAAFPNGVYVANINPLQSQADHYENPTSIARTLTHEYLHRPDQYGFISGYNDAHRALDEKAKGLIKQWGLDGMGCPAIGSGRY
jgi:RHS repeat-associated protein